MEDGRSRDVDAFGDFGVPVTEELHSQELPRSAVSRITHRNAVAIRVVGLVVIRFATNRDRIEPGCGRFMVAQAGAGGGHVKNLDDLGPEAAREFPVPTEGVLAGDPALLVGRGPERKIGRPDQAVVRVHAVTGREDIGQIGPHSAIDRDGTLYPEVSSGAGG